MTLRALHPMTPKKPGWPTGRAADLRQSGVSDLGRTAVPG